MSEENVLKAELNRSNPTQSRLAGALIIGGIILLALNLLHIHVMVFFWPMFLVGLGALMIWPAIKSTSDHRNQLAFMAVPGAMLVALGGLSFLMMITSHYGSWAYVWPLLLAAGAAGYIYMHRFDDSGNQAEGAHRFIRAMVIIFMVLAVLFELFVFQSLGAWWPLLLIGVGLYLIVKNKRSVNNE